MVAHNDDDEFPLVAVVIADGQVLARYPVRTAAGRAKLDEAFAVLKAQAATQTDAARYAELSDIIAWLDAMPHTESAGVIAAQRERPVAEQMEIAKRRPNIAYPHSSALEVRPLRLHQFPSARDCPQGITGKRSTAAAAGKQPLRTLRRRDFPFAMPNVAA